MGVNIDLAPGGGGSHEIIQGWAISRLAIVTGILATDTGTMLQEAEAALIAVVGNRGSPCPGISVPTYLQQFVHEAVSDEEVRIRIVYKGFPAPVYEFTSSLSQIQSNLDVHSSLISVVYYYPSDYVIDPRVAGSSITQGGLISRPIPEASYTVKFVVTSGNVPDLTVGLPGDIGYNNYIFPGIQNATNVATWFTFFIGTTNNAPYSIGLQSGAAYQWLIDSVRGLSRDGGNTYEMSMTFHFRTQGWKQLVVFVDPNTGLPPSDLTPSLGSVTKDTALECTFPTFTFGPN